MSNEKDNVTIQDTRLIFKNFSGREGKFNREGDRNFAIVLDKELYEELLKDGWNVKKREPRSDEYPDEEPLYYLGVTIGAKGRPPRIVMITSRGRNPLSPDEYELLDWAEIQSVDLIIRPYNWAVNGESGVKAYLKSMYVIIEEDELDLKYADLDDINGG